MVKTCLKLMRVKHYLKNLLVFMALACSGQLLDPNKLSACVIGFFAFSAISSVVYIVNDIKDREKDRLHPTKCRRPIASGEISVKQACLLGTILLLAATVCCVCTRNAAAAALLVLYFLMNVGYSFGLKNVPLVDVTILVIGFFLRILYGAIITDIQISKWLYLTVFTGAFFFAFGKRRNELMQQKENDTREVLKNYSVQFLDKSMYMCLTLMNVFYALWSVDESTAALYRNDFLIFTVPIVLIITLRYSMDVEGESDGDPVEVLMHDKVLLLLCGVYALAMLAILYLPRIYGGSIIGF